MHIYACMYIMFSRKLEENPLIYIHIVLKRTWRCCFWCVLHQVNTFPMYPANIFSFFPLFFYWVVLYRKLRYFVHCLLYIHGCKQGKMLCIHHIHMYVYVYIKMCVENISERELYKMPYDIWLCVDIRFARVKRDK